MNFYQPSIDNVSGARRPDRLTRTGTRRAAGLANLDSRSVLPMTNCSRTPELTRRAGTLLLLGVALGSLWGCQPSPRIRAEHPLLESPLGVTFRKMWEAHGSWTRWEQVDAVELRFQTSGDPAFVRSPEWSVRFDTRDPATLEFEGETLRIDHAPRAEGEAALVDFHLKTARLIPFLPLLIGEDFWQFRLDVFPEGRRADVLGFWVVPELPGSVHLGYYVVLDPETYLVDRVFYQSDHPHHHRRLFEVEFREYRRTEGLLLPRITIHRALRRLPDPDRHPRGVLRDPFEAQRFQGVELPHRPTRVEEEVVREVGDPQEVQWTLELLEVKLLREPPGGPGPSDPDGGPELTASPPSVDARSP